jgi:hypothetical protein
MNRAWRVSAFRGGVLITGLGVVVFASFFRRSSEPVANLPVNQYYISDGNFQYYAPGPEFKLQREAAAMKAYKSDSDAQQAERRGTDQSSAEQTLPPVWFGANDDVVYFAPGPEFKLQREAAAKKAQQAGRQGR